MEVTKSQCNEWSNFGWQTRKNWSLTSSDKERGLPGQGESTGHSRSSVVKGTKYILLRNRCDITKATDIERLNAALELNSDLSTAYYLKEESKLIWMCDDKKQAEAQLRDWTAKRSASGIPELIKLAHSISAYSYGILSFYDEPISTAMVEGINNKIKTLKRMAYGFRDNDYFNIRLLALHGYKVA